MNANDTAKRAAGRTALANVIPGAVLEWEPAILGGVACGIFAHRRAAVIVVGHAAGSVSTFETEEQVRD